MELLAIFATFGLTLLLTEYDGPFGVIYKIRQYSSVMQCFGCTSVWVAGFLSIMTSRTFGEFTIHTFAYCGAAILLNEIRRRYGK